MFSDLGNWWPDLLGGLGITVWLTLASMALALVIGLVLALARLSDRRMPLYWISTAFVEIIRGSPLLLQLFYIYYVLPLAGIKMSPFVAGLLGLAINYGAYLSEVFRAGIVAIPSGQREAALALGLHRWQVMATVVLPQAIRIVVAPVGNYFIALFKDTALVSTISIAELLFRGQLIASETFEYSRVYTFIFFMYLAISFPASATVKMLERRLSRGGDRKG